MSQEHEYQQQGDSTEWSPTADETEAAAAAAAAGKAPVLTGAVDYIDAKFHTAKEDGVTFDLEASAKKQAEAYQSLQGKFTQKSQAAAAAGDALNTDELAAATQQASADSPLGQALAAATAAYEGEGMDDTHFAALEAAGLPVEYVQQYIDNFEAGAEQHADAIHALAGGEEGYAGLMEWAGANLSEQEITTFDAAIESGDLERAKLMTTALQARFEAVGGRQAHVDLGGAGGHGNVGGYRDSSEQIAAQQDPRYKVSEAYRQEVAAKIAASRY